MLYYVRFKCDNKDEVLEMWERYNLDEYFAGLDYIKFNGEYDYWNRNQKYFETFQEISFKYNDVNDCLDSEFSLSGQGNYTIFYVG